MITQSWRVEKKTAKELNLIPKRCPSLPISCVRFGNDRIAACSPKAVIYSTLSNPDPKQQALKPDQSSGSDSGKVIDLQWDADKLLLVVAKKGMCVIDTESDALTEYKSEEPITSAFWLSNGNIVCVLESGVVSFLDREFTVRSRQALESKPSCAACDSDLLFVGVGQNVEIYNVGGETLEKAGQFVASPVSVIAIQILREHLLVSSDSEAVLWSKGDYIPLMSLKKPPALAVADPDADLAIGVGKTSETVMMLMRSGKKAEIREKFRFVRAPQNREFCADWQWQEDGSKLLALGLDEPLSDYQQFVFVRFIKSAGA